MHVAVHQTEFSLPYTRSLPWTTVVVIVSHSPQLSPTEQSTDLVTTAENVQRDGTEEESKISFLFLVGQQPTNNNR